MKPDDSDQNAPVITTFLARLSRGAATLTGLWLGFTALARGAPHGYKGLEGWELTLDLVLIGIGAVFAGAALLFGEGDGGRGREARDRAKAVLAASALFLLVPCFIAFVWGSRL